MNTIEMPRTLTAENGAKYALIGEFFVNVQSYDEEGEEVTQVVQVPWTMVKDIYRVIVEKVENGDITS